MLTTKTLNSLLKQIGCDLLFLLFDFCPD